MKVGGSILAKQSTTTVEEILHDFFNTVQVGRIELIGDFALVPQELTKLYDQHDGKIHLLQLGGYISGFVYQNVGFQLRLKQIHRVPSTWFREVF